MYLKILTIFLFIITYFFIIRYYDKKQYVVWIAVFILLITTILSPGQALNAINWNVILLYFGMLFVSEIFLYSRMPDFLAVYFASKTTRIGVAMLVICALTSALSILLENVACVLLVAPIALSIAKKCKINATPLFVGMAISSNLQGVGTLIGDPPSMLLGGFKGLNFNDFFVLAGKPGIFFAVQVGALVSLIVLYLFFKKFDGKMPKLKKENYISFMPTLIVILLVVALILSSFFEHYVPLSAGVWCCVFGLIAYMWYIHHTKGHKSYQVISGLLIIILILGSFFEETIQGIIGKSIGIELIWCALCIVAFYFFLVRKKDTKMMDFLERMDWQTGLFLIGIFIFVESLVATGLVDDLAHLIGNIAGSNLLLTFVIIVVFSVAVSAFVDNVPYLVIMLPVAQTLTTQLGANEFVLFFGLLLGASVGGNITPVGAAANIVAMGMVKKQGYPATFWDFVKIGLPFTICAIVASTAFVWFVFGA